MLSYKSGWENEILAFLVSAIEVGRGPWGWHWGLGQIPGSISVEPLFFDIVFWGAAYWWLNVGNIASFLKKEQEILMSFGELAVQGGKSISRSKPLFSVTKAMTKAWLCHTFHRTGSPEDGLGQLAWERQLVHHMLEQYSWCLMWLGVRNMWELQGICHFAVLENGSQVYCDHKFRSQVYCGMWSLSALKKQLTRAVQHASGKPVANVNSALTLGHVLWVKLFTLTSSPNSPSTTGP